MKYIFAFIGSITSIYMVNHAIAVEPICILFAVLTACSFHLSNLFDKQPEDN